MLTRYLIKVKGIVQGVGFRPFVYRLALEIGLKGMVINTPEGVEVDVEGQQESVDRFVWRLRDEAPVLARIDEAVLRQMPLTGYTEFTVGHSAEAGRGEALVSADISICRDCLNEMKDLEDRRFGYPLINCTNCGPRYTIITDIPYDRKNTTMAVFPMCPRCQLEYGNPADRRFHAQPNACQVCGPRVVLRDSSGGLVDREHPISSAARLLGEKSILGIKGIGGYHLACNALDNEAVKFLRQRKVREDKPFAVMVRDLAEAARYCRVGEEETRLLESPERPIVLLKKKGEFPAEQVAPGNQYLGLMLPYAPLHYLIFEQIDFPLVMTSGNLSDEPIAYKDEEAFMRLGEIAEHFLTHDREIHHRIDDSVTRIYRGNQYPVRRARGYAPAPIRLNRDMVQILAVGGEQKNTFCLTKGHHAFVSHHIGDLENLETLEAFEQEISMYKKLFHIEPEIIAYDYHPEYLSTKYAHEIPNVKRTAVQHHHAHIVGCMAEHGLEGSVLGVAFDGTGFGPDGSIWGGEFLLSSLTDFKRIGHLKTVPMPGGARAIREPWRMASGYLYSQYGTNWRHQGGVGFLNRQNGMVVAALEEMMEKWINCPPTSSMGRLFDAVAALMGIRDRVNYEGQAAVELEQLAARNSRNVDIRYNYVINEEEGRWIVDTDSLIAGVIDDLQAYNSLRADGFLQDMAYKFHLTVTDMVTSVCIKARERYGENRVCLSGGVFQNMLLLDMVHSALEQEGFAVFVHRIVPANDGGISLGQAVIADERRKAGCV